ncbi:MAG: NDP-sugar synthase [Microthrixaceae bacterium]
MIAVVLVGGFGTRLRPLTLTRPKQMLPVGQVTMLERVLAKLAAAGVTQVVLSLGYQPDSFVEAFPSGTCAGVDLHYAVEPEPLDTAGAIRFAAQDAGISERFFAINGDVLTDLDLRSLWASHDSFGGEATLALTPVEDPSRYGVVPIDSHGRVEAFIEKPAVGTALGNWINAGTYVLEPTVLDRIPAGCRVSIERETFPSIVEDRSLFAVHSEAYWIDAGTPEAYLQAHLDLIDGVRGQPENGVDPSATVHADALVVRSMIGPGAQIDAAAQIVDSVVMANCHVGAQTQISRSILGGRCTVGEGAKLSDLSIVGFDQELAAHTVAVTQRFPPPESW